MQIIIHKFMDKMEMLGLRKVELTKKQSNLIDELNEFSDEPCFPLITKIIQCVEYGLSEDAKKLCFTEADKFRMHPDVIAVIKNYLFEEDEDKPWGSWRKKK